MVKVNNLGVVLMPTKNEFERRAVLNPACVCVGNITHMFYRAVDMEGVSSIGYCQIDKGKVKNRLNRPIMKPEFEWENRGVEDPDVTYLDGQWYMLYVAYDGQNAQTGLAVATKLPEFERKGIVSPPISYDLAEDIFREKMGERYVKFEQIYRKSRGDDVLLWAKDFSLFPKKIKGKYAMMHRVLPGIQIVYFNDFDDLTIDFWKDHLMNLNEYTILEPKHDWENAYMGGGCPPIETEAGWLLVNHSVEERGKKRIYRTSVALLDKKDPLKVIGRLPYPLFSPETDWEKIGEVNNVVFPSGAILEDNNLVIYYGAADSLIAAKSVNLLELLREMTNEKTRN